MAGKPLAESSKLHKLLTYWSFILILNLAFGVVVAVGHIPGGRLVSEHLVMLANAYWALAASVAELMTADAD